MNYLPPACNALHIAAAQGNAAEVLALLQQGLDVNSTDGSWGMTALHYAVREGHAHIAQILLEAGANPNVKSNDDILSPSETPLHLAAGEQKPNCVAVLLDYKADLEATNGSGQTPLLEALDADVLDLETVRVLIARGADINACAHDGETVWQTLSRSQEFDHVKQKVAQILTEAGSKYD